MDMDFAENSDIVHKVKVQSEHWSHQQVTLYIVVTHFKHEGSWKSEAHVLVPERAEERALRHLAISGDRDFPCG